jgi:magnesium transporter
MITVKVQSNGAVIEKPPDLRRISDIIQDPAALIWIDVVSPTPDDLDLLSEEFEFHPLALEDAVHPRQRARLDEYETFLAIFFYAIDGTQENEGEVGLSQLSIFAGSNYVVTVHDRPLPALDETSERWRVNYERIKGKTAGLLVYSILDAIVDGYLPLVDQLSDRIDALEDAIFQHFDIATQQEIFRLKREMLRLRHVLSPERDVINILMRRDTPIFSDAETRYFQDIYDHLQRVLDSIDTFRDLLSSALDSYLTVVSNRLNKVMKTLTASSIVLMSMTLVAGVYGMNFEHMPELNWLLGYPWALGLMVTIGVSLGVLFKRIDWL